MTRRRKDPLRHLTDIERRELHRLRPVTQRPPAARRSSPRRRPPCWSTRGSIIRKRRPGGRPQRAATPSSHLVARYNQDGRTALAPRHGGGRAAAYDAADRDRILREVVRTPTPGGTRTATWSPLAALRRVLRSAPDGLPRVSTFTLLAGTARGRIQPQQDPHVVPDRGGGSRRRKAGTVTVTDPDAESKKS